VESDIKMGRRVGACRAEIALGMLKMSVVREKIVEEGGKAMTGLSGLYNHVLFREGGKSAPSQLSLMVRAILTQPPISMPFCLLCYWSS